MRGSGCASGSKSGARIDLEIGIRVRHHCKGMQRQENRVHRAHTRVV